MSHEDNLFIGHEGENRVGMHLRIFIESKSEMLKTSNVTYRKTGDCIPCTFFLCCNSAPSKQVLYNKLFHLYLS